MIAARGEGTIGFDQTLDLDVNAGPIEKIQEKLGPLGSLVGKVTDFVQGYTVKGTLADPKLGLRVAGVR